MRGDEELEREMRVDAFLEPLFPLSPLFISLHHDSGHWCCLSLKPFNTGGGGGFNMHRVYFPQVFLTLTFCTLSHYFSRHLQSLFLKHRCHRWTQMQI